VNNPDADLRGGVQPSTLFWRGAPGQGADAVSTAIHGGARTKRRYFTPRDDNNAGLTPLCPCLKAPFWHQKVHSKPLFAHNYDDISAWFKSG